MRRQIAAMAPASRADRIKGAIGAAALQALLLYALLHGQGVTSPPVRTDPLKLFDVLPAPPPPHDKPVVPHARSHRRAGAAAQPDLRARPTEIVLPPRAIPLTLPPPVVVAPVAGAGAAPSAGAADIRGPGSGAGGTGNGPGSGGRGDGDGGGDGGGETPPRKLKGRIRNSDYPRAAADAGAGGTVSVRYTVAIDGRVSACRVTHSSGNAALDEATCALIIRRFRFDPSRDAADRPVASEIVEDHDWAMEYLSPEADAPRR